MNTPAILALADGTIFHGVSIGAEGCTVGEVVFNTAMTGYQEILTDPSYAKQLVTLTYPHIGNTGINSEDNESNQVWAAGLIIRDLPLLHSNWRAEQSLSDYLQQNNVVAIADIDTRKLTRLLRDKGAQNACLMSGDDIDEAQALAQARAFSGLEGLDLAKEVTTSKPYTWTEGSWQLGQGAAVSGGNAGYSYRKFTQQELKHHVVVYDFGVKHNILRLLVDRGCRLTVVPAQTSVADVLALNPDGVFLSNGPGDPAACDYAIAAIRQLLQTDIPLFGICLGHQLLALAAGARSFKMKFGHHGANHPVQDEQEKIVAITSQNHGFAVDENSLPANVEITHRSLFDKTVQGIRLTDKAAYSFQGHPEASPGPHDVQCLFDPFIRAMVVKNHSLISG